MHLLPKFVWQTGEPKSSELEFLERMLGGRRAIPIGEEGLAALAVGASCVVTIKANTLQAAVSLQSELSAHKVVLMSADAVAPRVGGTPGVICGCTAPPTVVDGTRVHQSVVVLALLNVDNEEALAALRHSDFAAMPTSIPPVDMGETARRATDRVCARTQVPDRGASSRSRWR